MVGTTTPKVMELPKAENTTYKVVKEISNKDVANMMSTEQYVRKAYKDTPVLIEIAYCESRFRHFNNEGNAIKNKDTSATGVMQIMASIHEEDAEKLGMDINTLEGNVRFAQYLYDKYGTKPWEADKKSKNCWEPRSEALAVAIAK
jgi:hypothetical protein